MRGYGAAFPRVVPFQSRHELAGTEHAAKEGLARVLDFTCGYINYILRLAADRLGVSWPPKDLLLLLATLILEAL